MSTVSGLMSGGAPLMMSYQIGDAADNVVGEPLYVGGAAKNGLLTITAPGTAIADYVGLALDAAVHSTTQGSAESLVKVVINPDAIVRSRMVADAAGTDMAVSTVTTADSTGLTVVDTGLTMSEVVDGVFWGISGANVSQVRVATSQSSNTMTFINPFDNVIAVGDTIRYSSLRPASMINEVLFTTAATELDVQTTLDTTGQHFMCLYLELEGVANSYAYLTPTDSIFGKLT